MSQYYNIVIVYTMNKISIIIISTRKRVHMKIYSQLKHLLNLAKRVTVIVLVAIIVCTILLLSTVTAINCAIKKIMLN